MMRTFAPIALAAVVALCSAPARAGESTSPVWRPDLFFDGPASANDFGIDTTSIPGRWLYRFRTSLPNIGQGPLVLRATGEAASAGLETVNQQIFREDGTSFFVPAGDFRYNTETERLEALGWAEYFIREITPGDGVGPILAVGGKLAVRITSSTIYTDAIPNVPPRAESINAVGGFHGISVGYTDIYLRSLDQQWVDFTGVCPGEYWLELVVNRNNHVEESNYDNNVTRIKIDLPSQTEGEAEGEAPCRLGVDATHSADRAGVGDISLSDLLRAIQIFNSPGYRCEDPGTPTEDGYRIGEAGSQDCAPHASDYNAQDWRINLSELIRLVQFFNSDGYYYCPEDGTEDGYCPLP